ncbi:MAG: SGNH/GDSL hydrolase family protein [Patescibacteria group bacterium]
MKTNPILWAVASVGFLFFLATSKFSQKVFVSIGGPEKCSDCRVFAEADKNAPENAVVFLGDSMFSRMQENSIVSPAVNYSIGGEDSLGLARRVRDYHSLSNARAVVINGRVNDVHHGVSRQGSIKALKEIIDAIPTNVPIFVVLILPTSQFPMQKIDALNAEILKLPRVRFIDARYLGSDGALRPEYDFGDKLHLSALGMKLLTSQIRRELNPFLQARRN